jgi:hydroxymethylpyrimidine pyrophosphatase-like HAD family hydrolase
MDRGYNFLIMESNLMSKHTPAEALVMDIDGTLTPPRERMRREMADALSNLTVDFFLAAGSDLPLVKDQFFDQLEKFKYTGAIEAFLNNGTAQYRCDYSKGYSINAMRTFDIKKHLGAKDYSRVLLVLKNALKKKEFALPASIKVTGEQIIERGSMVNFAPIGRPGRVQLTKTDLSNRGNFVDFDRAKNYRAGVLKYLETELADLTKVKKLKFMFGGQTSFDIVIKGMDKTNPIKILLKRGYGRIVFLGDALFKGGNDSVVMDFINEWDGPKPCPVVAIKVESWRNTIDQFRANGWLKEKE